MDATAAEACRLTDRIQAIDRRAGGGEDAAPEVRLDAAQALAREDELADRDEGHRALIENLLEVAEADPVSAVLAEVQKAAELVVVEIGRAPVDLGVVVAHDPLYRREVRAQAVEVACVHLVHELGERARRDDVVRAFAGETVDELLVPEQKLLHHEELSLVAESRHVVAARDRELLFRDRVVQDLPRVLAGLRQNALHEEPRVGRADQGHGADALSRRVQPESRAGRDEGKSVVRLAFCGMVHAGGIVPVLVEVRDVPARPRDRVVHRAVAVDVGAVEKDLRRRAPGRVPVRAHLREVSSADAAGRDHDLVSTRDEAFSGEQIRPDEARDPAARDLDVLHGVTESDRVGGRTLMRGKRADDLLDDGMPRAPRDVPARDRVARRVESPLGPVHDGQELHADAVEVRVNEVERALAVELRPAARPRVPLPESREGKPVVERQLGRVGDAGLPLMGRADEVDASERLLGEAAEVVGHVLVEEENGLSVVEKLVRGDEPGESRAGDHDVRLEEVLGHRCRLGSSHLLPVRPPRIRACLRRRGRRRRASLMRSRASASSRAEPCTSWSEPSRRASRSFSGAARSGRPARSRRFSQGWNGRLALWIVAAGLFAFVLFRAAQFRRTRSRLARLGYAVGALGGLVLAVTAVRVLLHFHSGGDAQTLREAAARVVSRARGDAARSRSEGRSPFVVGVVEALRAAVGKLPADFTAAIMARGRKKWTSALARIGVLAHGAIVAVTGYSVFLAGLEGNPRGLSGTAAALRTIKHAENGPVLFALVAAGLIAYGLSLLVLAAHRLKRSR